VHKSRELNGIQPVPEKMRLEMVIGMEIEISNGSFEKRLEL